MFGNLIKFAKDAGAKIGFGKDKDEDAKNLKSEMEKHGFKTDEVDVAVEGDKVVLTGKALSQEEREKLILVAGNVEGVDSVEDKKYSLEITDNHIGNFTQGSTVTFIDRDGITEYTGTVIGVVNDVSDESSSTYISHNDSGDLLLESGQPAVYVGTYDGTQSNTESTFGGGLLLEESSIGSLYSLNDKVFFAGSKNNTNASECQARVDGLSKGGITKIFIETGGQNYEGGDLIVFENAGTQGGGAEAVIGSVGDEVLLEGGSTFGHYEVTATAGQTLVGGPGVRDDNGNLIIFNDNTLKVFVDDVLQKHKLRYRVSLEAWSWEIIKKYVELGLGLSIVTSVSLTGNEQLIAKPLSKYFPDYYYGVTMKRQGSLSLPAKNFLELIDPSFFQG